MILRLSIPCLSEDQANFIEHDDAYWELLPFFEDNPKKHVGGRNGQIFQIIDPLDNKVCIIKFSKFSEERAKANKKDFKRLLRFYREIEALKKADSEGIDGIISIYGDGVHEIEGETFPYFIMEKCDCNLKEYINKNEIAVEQRILLCFEIAKTIKILHGFEIYHRDIKAENIFFIGNIPIVGDLGLAEYRDSDYTIYEHGEIIGPIGWMSPESTNKFITEKTRFEGRFNCKLSNESDVFQLGKLFWLIMQGNLPLGQIIFDDFQIRDNFLFNIIFGMLQYDQGRRLSLSEIETKLKELFPTYFL